MSKLILDEFILYQGQHETNKWQVVKELEPPLSLRGIKTPSKDITAEVAVAMVHRGFFRSLLNSLRKDYNVFLDVTELIVHVTTRLD